MADSRLVLTKINQPTHKTDKTITGLYVRCGGVLCRTYLFFTGHVRSFRCYQDSLASRPHLVILPLTVPIKSLAGFSLDIFIFKQENLKEKSALYLQDWHIYLD